MGWWTPESVEKFENKAQCIISQYGNYTAEQVGLKLNGIISQGENIADNGGIKEAYLGYGNFVFLPCPAVCIYMIEKKLNASS